MNLKIGQDGDPTSDRSKPIRVLTLKKTSRSDDDTLTPPAQKFSADLKDQKLITFFHFHFHFNFSQARG